MVQHILVNIENSINSINIFLNFILKKRLFYEIKLTKRNKNRDRVSQNSETVPEISL